ncbi:hypothetical protein K469DRAFT_737342 [Zopfia rhizophila CBS 207.26]|uniref:Xylanolytic transcriptional activator regulatory domain-containing protein n=1 Tax=Zopfia rhizophila CBS 207.26 TaxID=1314779 RepID=A0A6A6EDH5_9PEZI|nr:hypothetical protein K469DRAFT_737342 [Zopfia rhizophila CBS 207.26]
MPATPKVRHTLQPDVSSRRSNFGVGRKRTGKPTAYIQELLRENERLRERKDGIDTAVQGIRRPTATAIPPRQEVDNNDSPLNPLLDERPWFFPMSSLGTPIYIGEAADAAFATRFRQALSGASHKHIPRTQFVSDERLMLLSNSSFPWLSPTRARFLVKVALQTVCRYYHVVRQSVVLESLENAIQNSTGCDRLSISRLWALFALGEVYSARSAHAESFPGLAYFAQATKGLPVPSERPKIESIETLLLFSLYSFALNRRHCAYSFAGTAIRLCVVIGLHMNIPESQLNDRYDRENRNRVFYTAYIFDRMWASKLGQPVSIRDNEIELDAPSSVGLSEPKSGDFGDPKYIIFSIKLAQLATHVIATIYDRSRQQGAFSQRVQQALRDLRSWVGDLPDHLILNADEPSQAAQNHIVYLHLSFNQCVILATRPVLLHNQALQIPENARALAEACVRTARHSYRLLMESWIDGSFLTFDYFYTQYLFSAATILAISSLLNGKDSRNDGEDFEAASQFLAQLKQSGNFAASEFCGHFDAMKVCMEATPWGKNQSNSASSAMNPALTTTRPLDAIQDTGMPYAGTIVTAGMALTEPTLDEFLSQPNLDLGFLDTLVYDDGLQNFYWPDAAPL